MPSYKLIYFNMRGRAEISRILFAQAGVEYEDCRLTNEEFAAMKADKKKLPLGQIPVLVIDDHPPMPHSHVIERHLARTFGLYGKNEKETIFIDIVGETLIDALAPLERAFPEKDEVKRKEIMKAYVEKDTVTQFTALNEGLKKNKEGKGYFVGEGMTLADIFCFVSMNGLMKYMPELGTLYPALKDHHDRMAAEPKIAAWLAKRPKTEF